jgi:hypothetical protein
MRAFARAHAGGDYTNQTTNEKNRFAEANCLTGLTFSTEL